MSRTIRKKLFQSLNFLKFLLQQGNERRGYTDNVLMFFFFLYHSYFYASFTRFEHLLLYTNNQSSSHNRIHTTLHHSLTHTHHYIQAALGFGGNHPNIIGWFFVLVFFSRYPRHFIDERGRFSLGHRRKYSLVRRELETGLRRFALNIHRVALGKIKM